MRRRILVATGSQGRVQATAGKAVEDVLLHHVPEAQSDSSVRAQDNSEYCHLMSFRHRLSNDHP